MQSELTKKIRKDSFGFFLYKRSVKMIWFNLLNKMSENMIWGETKTLPKN